jgi:hypothetical protein
MPIAIRGPRERGRFFCLLGINFIVPSNRGAQLGFVMKLELAATLADSVL